jgi:hypothetical protein
MSLKQLKQGATIEFEQRIFEFLTQYTDMISDRKAGYLRTIHQSLIDGGFEVSYIQCSHLVAKFRKEHNIVKFVRTHRTRKNKDVKPNQPTTTNEQPTITNGYAKYIQFCERFKIILDEILVKLEASEVDLDERDRPHFETMTRAEKLAYIFDCYTSMTSRIVSQFEEYDELYPEDDVERNEIHVWISNRMLLELCSAVLSARNNEIMGPD